MMVSPVGQHGSPAEVGRPVASRAGWTVGGGTSGCQFVYLKLLSQAS